MQSQKSECVIKICVDDEGNIKPSVGGNCAPGEVEKAIDVCLTKGMNLGPLLLEVTKKERAEREDKEKENGTK